MDTKIQKGLFSGLFLITFSNLVLIENIDARVNKIEKRLDGTVDVTLEPNTSKKTKNKSTENNKFTGYRLYNNNTKIIFHDKKEFECLAENIYYESRGEPYIGKIAVAQITFNRAESGKWGHSFCDVIHAHKQFSWTLYNQNKPRGKSWENSKKAAKSFVNGTRIRGLNKTDHYHANYVSPYWKESMKKKAVIGNHIFYASR